MAWVLLASEFYSGSNVVTFKEANGDIVASAFTMSL